MIRSPRNRKPPKKFSPTQPNIYSQENYLLRFEDNDELIVVKRSSIRSIIDDKAIVGTGPKRRFAIIEAKGRIYILLFYKVVNGNIESHEQWNIKFHPIVLDLSNCYLKR